MKTALLITLLAFTTITYAQGSTADCGLVKYGKFEITDATMKHRSTLERTEDGLQKETDLATNNVSFSKVRWIDDCTYTLTHISGGNDTEVEKALANMVLTIQITAVHEDSYDFKAFIDEEFVVDGTAYIVED